jgi:hypothetical protein
MADHSVSMVTSERLLSLLQIQFGIDGKARNDLVFDVRLQNGFVNVVERVFMTYPNSGN